MRPPPLRPPQTRRLPPLNSYSLYEPRPLRASWWRSFTLGDLIVAPLVVILLGVAIYFAALVVKAAR